MYAMVKEQGRKRLGEHQLLAGVCADNEATIQSAASRLSNGENYGCAAHMAQLVVGDMMEAHLGGIVDRARVRCKSKVFSPHILQRLVVFFRNSRNNNAQLELSQPAGHVLQLKRDCATRWNSTLDMVQRLLRLLPAIEELRAKVANRQAEAPGLDDVLLPDDDVRKLRHAQGVQFFDVFQ